MNYFVSSALDLIVIGLGIFLCGRSIEESALGRTLVTRVRTAFDAVESRCNYGRLTASAVEVACEVRKEVYGS